MRSGLSGSCRCCQRLPSDSGTTRNDPILPTQAPMLQPGQRTHYRYWSELQFKSKVSVPGGLSANNAESAVEIFDPLIRKWTPVRPMPSYRSRVGTAVYERKVYLMSVSLSVSLYLSLAVSQSLSLPLLLSPCLSVSHL